MVSKPSIEMSLSIIIAIKRNIAKIARVAKHYKNQGLINLCLYIAKIARIAKQ